MMLYNNLLFNNTIPSQKVASAFATEINEIYLNAKISLISLGLVEKPSPKLYQILSTHNLPKPVYILENEGDKKRV